MPRCCADQDMSSSLLFETYRPRSVSLECRQGDYYPGGIAYLNQDAHVALRPLQELVRPLGISIIVREGAEHRAARLHSCRDGRHEEGLVWVEGAELGVQERPLWVRGHADADYVLEGADGFLHGRVGVFPGVADADLDFDGAAEARDVSFDYPLDRQGAPCKSVGTHSLDMTSDS